MTSKCFARKYNTRVQRDGPKDARTVSLASLVKDATCCVVLLGTCMQTEHVPKNRLQAYYLLHLKDLFCITRGLALRSKVKVSALQR